MPEGNIKILRVLYSNPHIKLVQNSKKSSVQSLCKYFLLKEQTFESRM